MVSGGSYGGYMSLAVATHYAARIRCSIDVVGISNFVTFLERTESYRRDLRRVEYGDERDPTMRAFLERIAPLTNAAKIAKPILVAQGKNDPRVPAERGRADRRDAPQAERPGLVRDGRRRGARLRQEAERRPPLLRPGHLREPLPPGVAGDQGMQATSASWAAGSPSGDSLEVR